MNPASHVETVAHLPLRRGFAALLLLAAAAFGLPAPASAASQPCESLGNGTRIGNAVVLVAKPIPAGDYTDAQRNTLKGLPAFCRVFALTRPHPSSRVLVEI